MENKQYFGSCLCGAIHYQINGEIGAIVKCHCQKCRKANGTAFATNAPIKRTDFKITQGEQFLKKYASSEATERCFCGECGSPIISIKEATPEVYRLRIGTLDTPLEHQPTQHLFVSSKAEWDVIYDDLPQFDGFPK